MPQPENYYRLLENYGNLIAGQEAQLSKLRQQREAVVTEADGARQQRDAAMELATASRGRAASLKVGLDLSATNGVRYELNLHPETLPTSQGFSTHSALKTGRI